MSTESDPQVENWYRRNDKGQAFQVVAVDEAAGLVELQHFDGDLEEMDLETWYRLDIQPIEPPEDWSGPLDVGEVDDITGTEVTDTSAEDWGESLEENAGPEERPTDETGEDEEDEWGEGYPEEEPLEQEPVAEAPETPEERRPRKARDAWSEE